VVHFSTWFVRVLDIADQSILVIRAHEEFSEREGLLGEIGVTFDVVYVAIRELLVVETDPNDGLAICLVHAGNSE